MDSTEKNQFEQYLDQVLKENFDLLKTNRELLKEYELARNEYNELANFIEVNVDVTIEKFRMKKKGLQNELNLLENEIKLSELQSKDDAKELSDELVVLRKTIQKLEDDRTKLKNTYQSLLIDNKNLKEKYEPISFEYKLIKKKNEDLKMLLREPESEKLKILHERLRFLEQEIKSIKLFGFSSRPKLDENRDNIYDLQNKCHDAYRSHTLLNASLSSLRLKLKIANNKNRELNEFLKKRNP